LIEGNVGTIYRHRAMLLVPVFAMASLGFVWLLDWDARRRLTRTAVSAGRVADLPDGAQAVT
jgi:hypothetical protein